MYIAFLVIISLLCHSSIQHYMYIAFLVIIYNGLVSAI